MENTDREILRQILMNQVMLLEQSKALHNDPKIDLYKKRTIHILKREAERIVT